VISVAPYKDRFAVFEDGVLLAVCCYKKGAVAVRDRLVHLQIRIRDLEAAGAPTPDFQENALCENR
jgi:hypothetical protein